MPDISRLVIYAVGIAVLTLLSPAVILHATPSLRPQLRPLPLLLLTGCNDLALLERVRFDVPRRPFFAYSHCCLAVSCFFAACKLSVSVSFFPSCSCYSLLPGQPEPNSDSSTFPSFLSSSLELSTASLSLPLSLLSSSLSSSFYLRLQLKYHHHVISQMKRKKRSKKTLTIKSPAKEDNYMHGSRCKGPGCAVESGAINTYKHIGLVGGEDEDEAAL